MDMLRGDGPVEKFARRFRLDLGGDDAAEARGVFDHERRWRWRLAVPFVLVIVALVAVMVLDESRADDSSLVLVFAPLIIGSWAVRVDALRRWGGSRGSGARTTDLVPPLLRLFFAVLAAAGVAAAVRTAVAPAPDANGLTAAAALVPTLAFVTAEISCAIVSRRPIPDRDESRHAVLALRSHLLTEQYANMATVAPLALAIVLTTQEEFGLAKLTLVVMLLGLLTMLGSPRPHRRLRSRLWPGLDPEETVRSTSNAPA